MKDVHLPAVRNNEGTEEDLWTEHQRVSALEEIDTEDLKQVAPALFDVMCSSPDLEVVRDRAFKNLYELELTYHLPSWTASSLERVNALYCIQVLRNFLSPRNEKISGYSTLQVLHQIVNEGQVGDDHRAFFVDIYHIIKGAVGLSELALEGSPDLSQMSGREAAKVRSDFLDVLSERVCQRVMSYPTGLDTEVVERRKGNRERIAQALGGDAEKWDCYKWQLINVIRNLQDLDGLVDLTADERKAIDLAVSNRIPFGITPYYLSLMDREPHRRYDHAIRAQVIPPLSYIDGVLRMRGTASLDFMREGDTSPIDLVTRRYPMIAILKPYNSCAQICVYCQRNWEIDEAVSPDALAPISKLDEALSWFQEHPLVSEMLITGGDPALLLNDRIRRLLSRVAELDHIKRVRLGTRLPVVLPMRFDQELIDIMSDFNDPSKRELCVVTHFEHPYEVTPEAMWCINKIRRAGLSVYNQQVFTMENSRRFETVALRLLLKQIGVDPYYTFNTKGKEETDWYRVPIARILQERKEEARMTPGLARTDVAVFNIPALGKNNIDSWQNHDLIMISPAGERIYEFHPWEKNIVAAPTYVYRDVPILGYLRRLQERGEDPMEYNSIWYYF